MIADNIVHGNADWECNASVDSLAIHFFGVQLCRLSSNDTVPKLAQINHLCTR